MSSKGDMTPLEAVWNPDAEPDDRPDGECQYRVVDEAPFSASTPYWREKYRLCQIVASHPESATLEQITNELHGGEELDKAGAKYQRARRFLKNNPTYFAVRKSNGVVSASPTLELLDLINGGIIQDHREKPSRAGNEYCERLLRGVKSINDKGERILEHNLKEYVDRINDLRLILRSETADPEYVSLPYKTRFNDEGRINKQWSIMSTAIEIAAEEWSNAALLTLTTDPKKFDSIYEMWDSINSNWNLFMSWLAGDAHLGYRPEYVKVLEATEQGFPHIHAIVFLEDESTRSDGMPWLENKNDIANYWGKYQAQVVDVKPLTFVEDLGEQYEADSGWVQWQADGDHGGDLGGDGNKDHGGQTAGEYLGKYLSAVYGGIKGMQGPTVATDGGQPVEEPGEEKYAEKAATWKLAIYWATGRKIRTESRELRGNVEERMEKEEEEEEEENDQSLAELISVAEYRFVGAYERGEIPAHIRNGLVDADRLVEEQDPPDVPPGAGDGGKPPNRVERMKEKHPVRAWPLIEGMMGSDSI